ncbi:MAG: hypothetical protein AMJ62_13650 [Myxococcales bacterium SG8_38]|nr:MAG: hypothetical protein AMJ62_13650 [Myxococcales bacterium SG8_38]
MARSLPACVLLVSIACGPSLKQAQRSEERYQGCFSGDYDPAVTPGQRSACWSGWLAHDAEDQPPERVAYAQKRLQQLASDGSTLPLPNPVPEPAPTREHEYPRPPPAVYPTSSCDPFCNDRWAACNSHCDMKDKSCAAACESEYRVCLGGCP